LNQSREETMNRFINDKIGRKKKKSDLENYPIETQLKLILAKFDDPIEAVRNILNPEYNSIVKSDLRVAPPRPKEPTNGIFRVIYSTVSNNGKKIKIKSEIIEATDGFDAKFHFDLSKNDDTDKSKAEAIGVECLYVPRSIRNNFLKEFGVENRAGLITSIVEQAWATLIEDLEIFEDEKPAPDLSKFINDDQSDFDK
jgi:hypothetical protein